MEIRRIVSTRKWSSYHAHYTIWSDSRYIEVSDTKVIAFAQDSTLLFFTLAEIVMQGYSIPDAEQIAISKIRNSKNAMGRRYAYMMCMYIASKLYSDIPTGKIKRSSSILKAIILIIIALFIFSLFLM